MHYSLMNDGKDEATMAMPPMNWPMPTDEGACLRQSTGDVGLHESQSPGADAANDNAVSVPAPTRSGGPRGRASAPARSFGATPAFPPAPAGGDRGIPHPWSPPPFTTAWLTTGETR